MYAMSTLMSMANGQSHVNLAVGVVVVVSVHLHLDVYEDVMLRQTLHQALSCPPKLYHVL